MEDKADRVRDAIVDAVVEMVDEHGWDHITVRRIGERMHYAASTIVYHVGSLEALTMAVRTSVAHQVIAALFDGYTPGPNQFAAAADRMLAWMRAHPHLFAFYVLKTPSERSLREVNDSVPTTYAPADRAWPKPNTLRYFDRALQCALEGAVLLDDSPERQRDFLVIELMHLDAQWRRLVLTT